MRHFIMLVLFFSLVYFFPLSLESFLYFHRPLYRQQSRLKISEYDFVMKDSTNIFDSKQANLRIFKEKYFESVVDFKERLEQQWNSSHELNLPFIISVGFAITPTPTLAFRTVGALVAGFVGYFTEMISDRHPSYIYIDAAIRDMILHKVDFNSIKLNELKMKAIDYRIQKKDLKLFTLQVFSKVVCSTLESGVTCLTNNDIVYEVINPCCDDQTTNVIKVNGELDMLGLCKILDFASRMKLTASEVGSVLLWVAGKLRYEQEFPYYKYVFDDVSMGFAVEKAKHGHVRVNPRHLLLQAAKLALLVDKMIDPVVHLYYYEKLRRSLDVFYMEPFYADVLLKAYRHLFKRCVQSISSDPSQYQPEEFQRLIQFLTPSTHMFFFTQNKLKPMEIVTDLVVEATVKMLNYPDVPAMLAKLTHYDQLASIRGLLGFTSEQWENLIQVATSPVFRQAVIRLFQQIKAKPYQAEGLVKAMDERVAALRMSSWNATKVVVSVIKDMNAMYLQRIQTLHTNKEQTKVLEVISRHAKFLQAVSIITSTFLCKNYSSSRDKNIDINDDDDADPNILSYDFDRFFDYDNVTDFINTFPTKKELPKETDFAMPILPFNYEDRVIYYKIYLESCYPSNYTSSDSSDGEASTDGNNDSESSSSSNGNNNGNDDDKADGRDSDRGNNNNMASSTTTSSTVDISSVGDNMFNIKKADKIIYHKELLLTYLHDYLIKQATDTANQGEGVQEYSPEVFAACKKQLDELDITNNDRRIFLVSVYKDYMLSAFASPATKSTVGSSLNVPTVEEMQQLHALKDFLYSCDEIHNSSSDVAAAGNTSSNSNNNTSDIEQTINLNNTTTVAATAVTESVVTEESQSVDELAFDEAIAQVHINLLGDWYLRALDECLLTNEGTFTNEHGEALERLRVRLGLRPQDAIALYGEIVRAVKVPVIRTLAGYYDRAKDSKAGYLERKNPLYNRDKEKQFEEYGVVLDDDDDEELIKEQRRDDNDEEDEEKEKELDEYGEEVEPEDDDPEEDIEEEYGLPSGILEDERMKVKEIGPPENDEDYNYCQDDMSDEDKDPYYHVMALNSDPLDELYNDIYGIPEEEKDPDDIEDIMQYDEGLLYEGQEDFDTEKDLFMQETIKFLDQLQGNYFVLADKLEGNKVSGGAEEELAAVSAEGEEAVIVESEQQQQHEGDEEGKPPTPPSSQQQGGGGEGTTEADGAAAGVSEDPSIVDAEWNEIVSDDDNDGNNEGEGETNMQQQQKKKKKRIRRDWKELKIDYRHLLWIYSATDEVKRADRKNVYKYYIKNTLLEQDILLREEYMEGEPWLRRVLDLTDEKALRLQAPMLFHHYIGVAYNQLHAQVYDDHITTSRGVEELKQSLQQPFNELINTIGFNNATVAVRIYNKALVRVVAVLLEEIALNLQHQDDNGVILDNDGQTIITFNAEEQKVVAVNGSRLQQFRVESKYLGVSVNEDCDLKDSDKQLLFLAEIHHLIEAGPQSGTAMNNDDDSVIHIHNRRMAMGKSSDFAEIQQWYGVRDKTARYLFSTKIHNTAESILDYSVRSGVLDFSIDLCLMWLKRFIKYIPYTASPWRLSGDSFTIDDKVVFMNIYKDALSNGNDEELLDIIDRCGGEDYITSKLEEGIIVTDSAYSGMDEEYFNTPNLVALSTLHKLNQKSSDDDDSVHDLKIVFNYDENDKREDVDDEEEEDKENEQSVSLPFENPTIVVNRFGEEIGDEDIQIEEDIESTERESDEFF